MQNFTFLLGFPSELPALELYRHCYKCSAFQVTLCLLAYLSCPNFSNKKDIHMKFPGLKDTFTEKQQPNQFYTFPMCHDLIFVLWGNLSISIMGYMTASIAKLDHFNV